MTLIQGRVGSLTVVGVGVALVGHATLDAVEHIRQAEKVIYLVNNPVTALWLRRLNPVAESLGHFYRKRKDRLRTYEQMVARILTEVRSGQRVCFAVYGHPGVGVYASREAIRLARAEGYEARMLPGISADACLMADLGVDPFTDGWQSLEASDVVWYDKSIDPTCNLILWQAGIIGISTARFSSKPYVPGLRQLSAALIRYYPRDHEVIAYEAATYPVCDPVIIRTRLSDLHAAPITPMTTLYVPPLRKPAPRQVLRRPTGSTRRQN